MSSDFLAECVAIAKKEASFTTIDETMINDYGFENEPAYSIFPFPCDD